MAADEIAVYDRLVDAMESAGMNFAELWERGQL